MSKYELALDYAAKKHSGKYRKGIPKKPYIIHPVNVSKLIEKYMGDDENIEDLKVVGLLHDTIEDTDATYEEEVSLFGRYVADIVISLSSDKKMQKELGKDVYLSQKMCEMDDTTLAIKLCDRLDNVTGLNIVDKEFNAKYIRETTYIINQLLLSRKLNDIQLRIINDITNTIKIVSMDDPMIIKPRKYIMNAQK